MARAKEPVALLKAKGKSHYSKEYLEKREAQEVKVEFTAVQAPEYLPQGLVAKFDEIAGKLLAIGIMTELDEDCLARYLIAEQQYLATSKKLIQATQKGDIGLMERLTRLQGRYFDQCRAAGNDLGLSITSRARLVVPETKEAKPENRFAKFVK